MNSQEEQIKTYVSTFSEKEKKAFTIAENHLGMTFQIEKSIGFLEWVKTQQENSTK